MKNDGGPAFPNSHECTEGYPVQGMNLRDWFAGQALQGVMRGLWEASNDNIAWAAYGIADAMLAEREKEDKP